MEISAAWLTEALGRPVNTAVVEDLIGGAATKTRVRLTGPGVPETVIVKSGATAGADAFFAGEVAFYRDVAPALAIGVPRCWHAAGTTLVLEDLRGATFFTAGDTLAPDQVADVLDVLARLHGSTWGSTALPAYPGPMRPVLAGMLSGRYWAGCLDRPRSASIPGPLREPGALRAAIEALWAADQPCCVVHGDAHIGNVYVAGDAPGLLDWQMAAVGDPFHDVAYFVTSALAPEDRTATERELVRHYLERLAAHGGPAVADAWDRYRRHLIHGLFWATNADGMYPEAVNATVVERFTQALAG